MYYTTLVSLLFVSFISSALAANCFGAASKLAVTEFNAFPSTVLPTQTVYVRTRIEPQYDMGSASVTLSVYYTDKFDTTGLTPLITIPGLNFCNLSTSITCPFTAGTHILSWEYIVPDILPGTYQVKYTILENNPPDSDPYSCIQFPITVGGTKSNSYTSWFQATLLGTALFTQQDYSLRKIGEIVQVGLAGPLNGSTTPVPQYGNIKFLSGSGDLVPNAYYDTSNFVWGLYGAMQKQTIGTKGQISHIYQGEWYLGYINANSAATGNYYDYITPLIDGQFTLNWTYSNSASAQISGSANFNGVSATLPYGWGFPLVFGRLGQLEIVTSDTGFLMVKGSAPFCASGVCAVGAPPGSGGKSGNGLSSEKLGLAIGLPIAAIFVILLLTAAFFYWRKKRETEKEDGVFAVSRKPEYGSALVVDGIIEETMGSKTMQAMLDMRDEDGSEGESDGERSDRARSRSRSRSRTVSRSRSGSRARSDSDAASASRDSDSE